MRVAVIAHTVGQTNGSFVEALSEIGPDASVLTPDAAVAGLGQGDAALLRLDVLPNLAEFEPGLVAVGARQRNEYEPCSTSSRQARP